MFALWYLSLAIDEIRKRLGWTSIFDIFKGNKVATDRAIEKKPEPIKVPTPKTPEPAKPAPAPLVQPESKPAPAPVEQPEVKPTPPPKPAAKPEPPKPKAESPAPPSSNPTSTAPEPKKNAPKIPSAESMDRKIFGAPKHLENGDSTPKQNIKDATSSFLAGEGQTPIFTQTKTVTLRYEAYC